MSRRKKLDMTDEERAILTELERAGGEGKDLWTALRAKALLTADRLERLGEKTSDAEIASSLGVSSSTITRLMGRFIKGRLPDAIGDKSPEGGGAKPLKISWRR